MKIKRVLQIVISTMLMVALFTFQIKADGPGDPGGDPDVPETPLDGGIWILMIVLLIYGIRKLNAPLS
jgi:hypothetical protein